MKTGAGPAVSTGIPSSSPTLEMGSPQPTFRRPVRVGAFFPGGLEKISGFCQRAVIEQIEHS